MTIVNTITYTIETDGTITAPVDKGRIYQGSNRAVRIEVDAQGNYDGTNNDMYIKFDREQGDKVDTQKMTWDGSVFYYDLRADETLFYGTLRISFNVTQKDRIDVIVSSNVDDLSILNSGQRVVDSGGARDFIQLTDTPSSYEGQAGKIAKVNSEENKLEFDTNSLLDLDDSQIGSYENKAGYQVKVNEEETGFEAVLGDNNSSTSIISGMEISINSATTINIAAGVYAVVDSETNPTQPKTTRIEFAGATNVPVTTISGSEVSTVYIDKDSNILFSATALTASQRRIFATIGIVSHLDQATIFNVQTKPATSPQPVHSILDYQADVNVKDGIKMSGVSGAQSFIKGSGRLVGRGLNYDIDPQSPNVRDVAEANPSTFIPVWRDGTGGITIGSPTTIFDNTKYDPNGNGTLVTLSSATSYANHWSYVNGEGFHYVVYGQVEYVDLDAAKDAKITGAEELADISDSLLNEVTLRNVTSLQRDSTDFSDSNINNFYEPLGAGGGNTPSVDDVNVGSTSTKTELAGFDNLLQTNDYFVDELNRIEPLLDDKLSLDGTDTMTGDLKMGGKEITNVSQMKNSTGDGKFFFLGENAGITSTTNIDFGVNGAVLNLSDTVIQAYKNIRMNSVKVINMPDGVDAGDAVNKGQLDILLADKVSKTSDETIAGNKTFSNDVTINGNLFLNGDATQVDSENVTVKDNLIVLNEGEVGAGITAGFAGHEYDRGSETNFQVGFAEGSGRLEAGLVGDRKQLALLSEVTPKEDKANKTDDVETNNSSSIKYASTKGVYDHVQPTKNRVTEIDSYQPVIQTGGNLVIQRTSNDFTLFDGRIEYVLLPDPLIIVAGNQSFSVDGGIVSKFIVDASDNNIDFSTTPAFAENPKYIVLVYKQTEETWQLESTANAFNQLAGAGWNPGQTVTNNDNVNNVQNSRIDDLEEAQTVAGQLVIREVDVDTDITAVPTLDLLTKITFNRELIASSDLTVIDEDAEFDHELLDENAAGYNYLGIFKILNAGSINSTFEVKFYLADKTEIAVTAIEVDKEYKIHTLGDTDFTLIGATSNTVNTTFIATGAGIGTGTVLSILDDITGFAIGSGNESPEIQKNKDTGQITAPFAAEVYYTVIQGVGDITLADLKVKTNFTIGAGAAAATTDSTTVIDPSTESLSQAASKQSGINKENRTELLNLGILMGNNRDELEVVNDIIDNNALIYEQDETVKHFPSQIDLAGLNGLDQLLDNRDNFSAYTTSAFTIENSYQRYTGITASVFGIVPLTWEASTTYTILTNMVENTVNGGFITTAGSRHGGSSATIAAGQTGIFKQTFTSSGTPPINENLMGLDSSSTTGSVLSKSVIIKGDHTSITDEQAQWVIDNVPFGTIDDPLASNVNNVVIEGNTFSNPIINGDFADGVNGWSGSRAVESVTDNILSLDGDGTGTEIYVLNDVPLQLPAINDKWFYYSKAKVVGTANNIKLRIYDGAATHSIREITSPVSGIYYEIYGIKDWSSIGTLHRLDWAFTVFANTTNQDAGIVSIDGNAGVFAINMTGTKYENYSEAQMLEVARSGYQEGLFQTGNTITTTGENMFDLLNNETFIASPKAILAVEEGINVWEIDNSTILDVLTGFESDTQYTFRHNIKAGGNGRLRVNYTDSSSHSIVTGTTDFIVVQYTSDAGKTIDNVSFDWGSGATTYISTEDFMVVKGTSIPEYKPYHSNTITYDNRANYSAGTVGNSVDEEGNLIERVKLDAIIGTEFTTLITSLVNVDLVQTTTPYKVDLKLTSDNAIGTLTIEGKTEIGLSQRDNVSQIGNYYVTGAGRVDYIVAKGTSVATAQAELDGLEIYYQVETPETIAVDPFNLQAYPNGQLQLPAGTSLSSKVSAGLQASVEYNTEAIANNAKNIKSNKLALEVNKGSIETLQADSKIVAQPRWTFSTTQTASDPSAGFFRFDSTFAGSVSEIYISSTKLGQAMNMSNYLNTLKVGHIIYIQQEKVEDKVAYYEISGAITDNTGWFTIPVTNKGVGNTIWSTDNADCSFDFSFVDAGGAPATSGNWIDEAVAPTTGDGSSGSPYEITTAQEAAWIAKMVNETAGWSSGKYFEFMNDIDLTGMQWTPIGSTASTFFRGTVIAENRTIKGLTITNYAATYCGFFGYINAADNPLELISFEDAFVQSFGERTGVFAGHIRFSNTTGSASITGYVRGANIVGGFAGKFETSGKILQNVDSYVNVEGDRFVGGILGSTAGGIIQNCRSFGKVIATTTGIGDSVGGIIGQAANALDDIKECVSHGIIIGKNDVGGLIGSLVGDVDDCISHAQVISFNSAPVNVGAFVGKVSSSANMTNCFSTGAVQFTGSSTSTGGFYGVDFGGTLTNCKYLVDTSDNGNDASGLDATLEELITFDDGLDTNIWLNGAIYGTIVPTLKAFKLKGFTAGYNVLARAASSGGGATELDDLTDVDTTTTAPVLGDTLVYDGTNFVPQVPAGGGDVVFTDFVKTKIVTNNGTTNITAAELGFDPDTQDGNIYEFEFAYTAEFISNETFYGFTRVIYDHRGIIDDGVTRGINRMYTGDINGDLLHVIDIALNYDTGDIQVKTNYSTGSPTASSKIYLNRIIKKAI